MYIVKKRDFAQKKGPHDADSKQRVLEKIKS